MNMSHSNKEERKRRREYMRAWRADKREEMAARSRHYYATHRKEVNERARLRRIRDAEQLRERRHNYYLSHLKEVAKNSRQWTAANPGKLKLARQRYRKKNRLKLLEAQYERRLRKRSGRDQTLSPQVLGRLFDAAKRCPDCGRQLKPANRSLDHVYPLSRGGPHTLLNVRVVCISCNSKKHTAIPEQLPLAINSF